MRPSVVLEAFLLGLANGTACLAYCAPVVVPLLLGEERGVRQAWGMLLRFLGGRFVGYLLFGLLSWAAGALVWGAGSRGNEAVPSGPAVGSWLWGAVYIFLGGMLLYYGLARRPAPCAASTPRLQRWLARWPAFLPVGMGLLTGLNLCPPFLAAAARAMAQPTLAGSLLFFVAFFAGTTVYFLPLPFVGALQRFAPLRTIGRMVAVLLALYYLATGALSLLGTFLRR